MPMPFPAAVLALLLMTAGTALASDDAARSAEVDRLMAPYQGAVPGAALMVIKDGTPLLQRGYGLAELESAKAVDAGSNFRLASISKQFTAMAVLLLAADGTLALDDPLARWLPGLPAATESVTLRHLLSHASGLVDYEDVMPADSARQLRDADVRELLRQHDRTHFAPGTGYRYSNSGYALLALVVQAASGQPYAQFLRQRIFVPLGMHNTHARTDEGPAITQRAYGYSQVEGQWRRTDQSSTSAVLGDGGIYSSLADLALWDAALYDGRLIYPAWLQQAFTAATPVADEQDVSGYGFGWRLHGEMQWHSGESIGFRNVLIRWPAQRLSVVLLSNRNDPPPYALARRIASLWGAPAP
jgi:CubicO group peptidase (beta-lactamase class C family)